jgi:hypothetical protein
MRTLVIASALVAVSLGCNEARLTETADAGHSACAAYLATYERCFDRLGPEARANGDVALAAARERLLADEQDDTGVGARCRAAAKQLDEACR